MHQISLITHKAKLILCAIVGLALLQSCNRDTFYNKVETLTSDEWLSKDAVVFELDVEDSTKPYDLSLILRHSGEYEYSNIFFLMHIIPPDSNIKTERLEFTLAEPDGEWLGSGLGDIYDLVLPVQERFVFPRTGHYTIAIEQNMRQDPLKGVESIGVKISHSHTEDE